MMFPGVLGPPSTKGLPRAIDAPGSEAGAPESVPGSINESVDIVDVAPKNEEMRKATDVDSPDV